jgi:hypothetical protein
VALLTVLILVFAITVISVGFVARCDVELACGRNTVLRVEMDQLADSGLEHARGLVLNPQEVATEYWTGDANQQLVTGSDDYYDVTVTRNAADRRTYDIACDAYRLRDAQKIGRSQFAAVLRLDPCITLWAGGDTTLEEDWVIQGDAYGAAALINRSTTVVDGDVFCDALTGSGSITGSSRAAGDLTLAWPAVNLADFTTQYSPVVVSSDTLSGTGYGPYDPPRVVYRAGDLTLDGSVTIDAMLLVDGQLTISGPDNTILAGKNLPAIYTTGDLVFHRATNATIEGLVVADGDVLVGADTSAVSIVGGLFTQGRILEAAVDSAGTSDAILCNDPTWRPAGGSLGGAMDFDGVDDYLQTPDSDTTLQVSGAYTLSLWLKPATIQKAWAGLISKTDPGGTINHWTLQADNTADREIIVVHGTTGAMWRTGIPLQPASPFFEDGWWHHVAVVRRSDGTTRSYYDGVLIGTFNDPNDPFMIKGPDTGLGHLNIGADRTASPDHVYQGWMDDVRIYNGALSETEVNTLAWWGDVAGALAHYRLDGDGSALEVAAAPARSAIVVWPAGAREHWSPAAGAFYRSLRRN